MATFSLAKDKAPEVTPAPEYVELPTEEDTKPIILILSNLTDVQATNADGTPMTELDEDGNENQVYVSETITKEFPAIVGKFSNTIAHVIDDIDDDEIAIPVPITARDIVGLMERITSFCDQFKNVDFPLKPMVIELKKSDGTPVMVEVLDDEGRPKRNENNDKIMKVKTIIQYLPTGNTERDWKRKMPDSEDTYLSQFNKETLNIKDFVDVSNEDETFDLVRLVNHLDIYPMLNMIMTEIANEIKKQPAEDQLELFERIDHPEYYWADGTRMSDGEVATMKRAQRDVKKAYKNVEKAEAKIKELTDELEEANKALDGASEGDTKNKTEAVEKVQQSLEKATSDLSDAHQSVKDTEAALNSIYEKKNTDEVERSKAKSEAESAAMEVEQ